MPTASRFAARDLLAGTQPLVSSGLSRNSSSCDGSHSQPNAIPAAQQSRWTSRG